MNSFLDLARSRYSLRAYDTRIVEEDKIERCLEAARLSPSACNAQPWKFTVVIGDATRAELAKACLLRGSSLNLFVKDAPCIVAISGESPNATSVLGSLIKRKKLFLLDIGMAAEHFCLQAAEEGLGSCMLGWFDEGKVKRILGVPRFKRVWLLIALGYPKEAGTLPEKKRKDLETISAFEGYSQD